MSNISVRVRCVLQQEDQVVDCASDWTVSRLKHHLAQAHPDKPAASQQKIIYMGHCLSDECQLVDALRPLEAGQMPQEHVVHLVFTPNKQQRLALDAALSKQNEVRRRTNTASSQQQSPPPSATAVDPPPASPLASSSTNAMWQLQHSLYQSYMYNYINYMNQIYAANGLPGGSSMMGAAMMPMQQQQFQLQPPAMAMGPQPFWLPQTPPTSPVAAGAGDTQAQQQHNDMPNQQPAGAAAAAVVDPVVPPPAAAAPAIGNFAAAEEDDEFGLGERDWLDWSYMLLRASLMIFVFYFYSSLERFLLVIVVFGSLYAVQEGWLARLLGAVQPNADVAAQNNRLFEPLQQQQQQPYLQAGQPPAAAAGGQPENNNNAADGAAASDGAVEPSAAGTEPTTPPLPDLPPSAWTIFWQTGYAFFTGFFRSLIPERPPPIELN